MLKGYFGEAGAQIHYRHWAAKNDTGRPPVILLPPSPHSGKFFETACARMNVFTDVYAVDYPGYGGSDTIIGHPSIEGYADALLPFMRQFGKVSLAGFHTGNLVALALASKHPNLIGQMILIDIPYFGQATRDKYAASLDADGVPVDIKEAFNKAVKGDSPEARARSYDLWIETQRSFAGRNDAFRAAFAYDAAATAKAIKTPTIVCGTDSSLYELSKEAAADIPGTNFKDWRTVKAPAFEMNDGDIGASIADILL